MTLIILKNYDLEESPSMCWGEDWDSSAFFKLYDKNIFILNEDGETLCQSSNQLMEFLIDHFVDEMNEHLNWLKGKTLVSERHEMRSSITYDLLHCLEYENKLESILKDEEKIESFIVQMSDILDVEEVPGFTYTQRLEGGPMSETYMYDAYFIDSEMKNAVDYVLKLADKYKDEL